jgi:hypothetical protein
MKEMGNKFHQKNYVGIQANAYKYMDMNLGCGIIFQHEVQYQANSCQTTQGRQPTRLLPSIPY